MLDELMKDNSIMYIVGVLVILVIAALLLLPKHGVSPSGNTTVNSTTGGNVTTTASATSIAVSTVSNLTVAVGPNLSSCNGYNVSTSSAYHRIIGYCNWRGGPINVSMYGGNFDDVVLDLVQQNATSTPFTNTTTASACTPAGGYLYLPDGNYKVTFTTGTTAASDCGSATMHFTGLSRI